MYHAAKTQSDKKNKDDRVRKIVFCQNPDDYSDLEDNAKTDHNNYDDTGEHSDHREYDCSDLKDNAKIDHNNYDDTNEYSDHREYNHVDTYSIHDVGGVYCSRNVTEHNFTDNAEQIINFCVLGNLSEAIEIYNKHKEEIESDKAVIFHEILSRCCENENANVDIVVWVHNVVRIVDKNNAFIEKACVNGKIDILKFFHSIGFDIHYKNEYLLQLACEKNQLLVAKWLLDMRAIINAECLKKACSSGNLDIVKWIVDVRESTDKRIFDTNLRQLFYASPGMKKCYNITDIFLDAYEYNHIDIAMILYNTWGNNIDIRVGNDRIFKKACKQRNIEFATTIYGLGFDKDDSYDTYGFGLDDDDDDDDDEDGCDNIYDNSESPKKCKVPTKKVVTDASRMRAIEYRNFRTLMFLCIVGNVDDIRWFCKFCEGMGNPMDITELAKDCFVSACSNLSYDVAQWFYNSNPMILVESLHNIDPKILVFLGMPHSTMYLLMQCSYNYTFNIDLVEEVDELALSALHKYRKYNILKKLEKKFGSITLEIDSDDGTVTRYYFNKNNIKSARKN